MVQKSRHYNSYSALYLSYVLFMFVNKFLQLNCMMNVLQYISNAYGAKKIVLINYKLNYFYLKRI